MSSDNETTKLTKRIVSYQLNQRVVADRKRLNMTLYR